MTTEPQEGQAHEGEVQRRASPLDAPYTGARADLGFELDVPISAIEHYSYCPRQCALIHVEQVWDENQFTIRGASAHERVDRGGDQVERGVRTLRDIPLWSDRLGLIGRSDVVELRVEGPYPVEYKVGRRHGEHADLQLCAQALCLEEMLDIHIARGAVYHRAERRRYPVDFDAPLRARTIEVIEAVRRILQEGSLPAAPNDARCPSCSLVDACMPGVVGAPARMRGLQGALYQPLTGAIDVEESGDAHV